LEKLEGFTTRGKNTDPEYVSKKADPRILIANKPVFSKDQGYRIRTDRQKSKRVRKRKKGGELATIEALKKDPS
jgi:hypothetical protein